MEGGVTFSGVSVEVTKREFPAFWRAHNRRILHEASGHFSAGEVAFVLGPSGSGKTTLLDALCGQIQILAGKVSATSRQIGGVRNDNSAASNEAFNASVTARRVTCKLVPSDPQLCAAVTVKQSMEFAAEVYLSGESKEKRKEKTERLLRALGLSRVANSFVGDNAMRRGISGGERRRLAIAIEMLATPDVLILDECTTGLDASSAYLLVRLLKDVARDYGTAVVMTVHQPSEVLFDLADSVVILSAGKVAYSGPANHELYQHFRAEQKSQDENLADWILSLVNTDFEGSVQDVEHQRVEQTAVQLRDDLIEKFPTSPTGLALQQELDWMSALMTPLQRYSLMERAPIFSFKGLWPLAKRQFQVAVLDPRMWLLRIIVWLFIALFSATIWVNLGNSSGKISAYIGYLVGVLGFECLVSVAAVPFRLVERELFTRERANAMYSAAAFCIVQAVSDVIVLFLWGLTATVCVYFIVGLTGGAWRFFLVATDLFLVLLCFESTIILIVALIPYQVAALGAGISAFAVFLITCGFLIPFSQLGWWYKWLRYINPLAYGFAGNIIANFQNTTWAPFCDLTIGVCFPSGVTGDQVISFLDMDDRVWFNAIIMVFYFVAFRFAAWFSFEFIVKPTK